MKKMLAEYSEPPMSTLRALSEVGLPGALYLVLSIGWVVGFVWYLRGSELALELIRPIPVMIMALVALTWAMPTVSAVERYGIERDPSVLYDETLRIGKATILMAITAFLFAGATGVVSFRRKFASNPKDRFGR